MCIYLYDERKRVIGEKKKKEIIMERFLLDIFRCEKAVKTTNDEYPSSRGPWNIYDAR